MISGGLLTRGVCLAAVLASARAGADGAFPDSFSLQVPADRPHQIILATNFGLVITEDDGASWRWVCERAVISFANLYQQGPAPGDSLYAVSPLGLVSSADACDWAPAGGSLAAASVADAFPDPNDPAHVLALATAAEGGPMGLYESTDGARTFGEARWRAAQLTGVEIARSAPKTVYLAGYDDGPRPYLLHSSDGGANFETLDASALGRVVPRLAAVDPVDDQKLYLRLLGTDGDSLGVSQDGGRTFATPFQLGGTMSAFLRRTDGAILVGTRQGNAYQSSDGGKSFVLWPNAPHLRGLAERNGILYAAGDNQADHFAVASSSDGGVSWIPLLRYDQILGPLDCPRVEKECSAEWQMWMSVFGIGGSPPADGGDVILPSVHEGGCSLAGQGCELPLPLLVVVLAWLWLRVSAQATHTTEPSPPQRITPQPSAALRQVWGMQSRHPRRIP